MPPSTSRSANTRKGKMVEALAARLLRGTGVEVTTRAMLRPASGVGRPREIDILATVTTPHGQIVRFAVECKNESAPIEAEYIDAFYGKLAHIGFPAENGIFVSRSRYRSGALNRAKEAGIRTLNIKGLRDDGLNDMIFRALQSIIWLLADAGQLTVTTDTPDGTIMFCDGEGRYAGMVCDLIYRAWIDGKIPRSLGEHHVELDIPSHWRAYTPTGLGNVLGVEADVTIRGIAYTVHGQATSHALADARDGDVHSFETHASWDESRDEVTVKVLPDVDALNEHVTKTEAMLHLVVRDQPLPRINVNSMYGRMYWPPSEAVASTLMHRYRQGEPMGAPEDDFEGTEFARIFDEPTPGYAPRWDDPPRE